MRTRHQQGSLQLDERNGVWVYRWREYSPDGASIRRGQTLGTTAKLKTKTQAQVAAEKFRLTLQPTSRLSVNTVREIAGKFTEDRMSERFSTRTAYKSYLANHILPKWGDAPIEDVKPYPVEQWLKSLDLAPKSKSHIRSILSQLFQCAMLWEYLELKRNPMELVQIKGSTKRQKEPRVLTVEEFQKFLKEIPDEPFRTMILTAQCLGLRCSELLALKWLDFDWNNLTILVQRGIVAGRVDNVKTKYSQTKVPLDSALANILGLWRDRSEFRQDADWVWASPFQSGEKPYRAWGVQQRRIKPAGIRAGLGILGWHTFRHTYRSWLDETGAPMKVQQELMRHASIQTTMNIYGAAMSDTKRKANSEVVKLALMD